MYVTTESGETHSYKSVIFCNDCYYCYDRELSDDEIEDQVLMLDVYDFEIEEISEGKYHVIN